MLDSFQVTPEELSRKLSNIQAAVFRCRDITRKLLGFVRRSEFNLERQSIPGLVNEVVDDFFAREMALSNITINREYATGLPEIETDKNQLQQVVLNLVKNAADAIEGVGTVSISIKCRDDRMRISITDTGKGISPKQLEKVFMPFFTTKDVGRGTGLGLSVSYGIVQGLGGDIEVRSKEGAGSTFTIVLPVS
jgi:two-component system NtrC family sensor kinase